MEYYTPTIVFDQKLKELVKSIKQGYADDITKLKELVLVSERGKSAAFRLRELFTLRRNELNFTTNANTLKNGELVALFTCLITDNLDEVDCWSKLSMKPTLVRSKVPFENRNHKGYVCCCGKLNIVHQHILQGNKHGCLLGSCCIKRSFKENDGIQRKLKQFKNEDLQTKVRIKKEEEVADNKFREDHIDEFMAYYANRNGGSLSLKKRKNCV
jgi:hypothetical protein